LLHPPCGRVGLKGRGGRKRLATFFAASPPPRPQSVRPSPTGRVKLFGCGSPALGKARWPTRRAAGGATQQARHSKTHPQRRQRQVLCERPEVRRGRRRQSALRLPVRSGYDHHMPDHESSSNSAVQTGQFKKGREDAAPTSTSASRKATTSESLGRQPEDGTRKSQLSRNATAGVAGNPGC